MRDDSAYTAGLFDNITSLGLFVAHPRTYAELLAGTPGDCPPEKGAVGSRHRSL
jgi:hypothetical protein